MRRKSLIPLILIALAYANAAYAQAPSVIRNTADQAALDRASAAIPGISVTPAQVFAARPGAGSPGTYGSGPLIDNGGSVLTNIKVYAIYWGSSSILDANYRNNTDTFLTKLSCSDSSLSASNPCTGLSSTLTQYSHGAGTAISWGRSFVDISRAPSSSPSTSTIANEVVKVVGAANIDRSGLYLVFTDSYPKSAGYCAWHSAATASITRTSSVKFTFGFMPNLTNVNGCQASYLKGIPTTFISPLGPNFDSLFNVTTHELYETMSDPMTSGYGWIDVQGYENGDKCAWGVAAPITQVWPSATYTFYVQQEWSNVDGNQCVSKIGG